MNPPAPTYRRWFWIVAAAALALDLGTKYWAWGVPSRFDGYLAPGEEREVVPGFFRLVHPGVPNQGAFMAFLSEQGDLANLLFAIVSIIAAILIVAWSFRGSVAGDRWLSLGLGLIFAGAIGNGYDRLLVGSPALVDGKEQIVYGVRDFLQLYIKWGDGTITPLTAIFNLADFFLLVGAGILLYEAFFRRREPAT
jgi:signal peptidase II